MTTHAGDVVAERIGKAERAIAEASQRARDLRTSYRDELERRDALIVEAVDEGVLSERAAARAAGLSMTGLLHVIARSG